MGTVVDGYHARVLDPSGNDAKAGEAGEFVLRSDDKLAFATGYFAMPEKTAEAFRDGWFHTGDRVVREADGSFRFVDRLKDAIRRRGENISSFEVEQVLLSHPDVGTAAVFPVPSELAEEEVMAAIVRRPGSALTENDPDRVLPAASCRICHAALHRIRRRAAHDRKRQGAKIQAARPRCDRPDLGSQAEDTQRPASAAENAAHEAQRN